MALFVLLVNTTQASVWTNLVSSTWEAATNWTGGVPNAAGAVADFSTLNITADVTVTLGSGKAVGKLLFGDTTASHGWTVTGSTLTLNNSGSAATNTVNALAAGKSATISSLLAGGTAGTVGLIKDGSGRLVVGSTGSTLSGDIAVSSGTLSASGGVAGGNRPIGSPSALGALDPARTITVNTGAVLTFTNSNDIFAQGGTTVVTPAPLLVVNAGGTVIIGHTSTSETGNGYGNNFGRITLNGGSISLLKGYNSTYGAAMLTDTITVGGAAASTISGNGMANSVAWLGYYGSTVGTTFDVADATGDDNADLTVSAPLRNAPNIGASPTSLTKTGAGTMRLTAANSYTGQSVINAGTLALGPGGSLSSTVLQVNSGAAFDVTRLAGSSYTVASGKILTNSAVSGAATINATGGTATLASGALAGFAASGGSGSVGKISVAGNLTLNNNTLTVTVTGAALGAGTYRLMDCTGTLSGTANSTPTIAGSGLAAGATATNSTTTGSGGTVDLVVTPPCAPPTTSFHVTGGGSYVSGGLGVPVGLSGSQSGVTYQLYTNGIATGQTVSGTGPAISFGNQTQAATYTVFSTATNGYCVAPMMGSPGNVTVTIIPVPRITQTLLTPAGLVLNGISGPPEGSYEVRYSPDLATPRAAWFVSSATNYFDENGHFTVTNVFSAPDPASFYCLRVITNGAVRPRPPFIIAQPASTNVVTGQTARFSVSAGGAAPLIYQWFFNTNTPLSNQTNSTLTLTNVQTSQAGKYSVTVANHLGTTNSGYATLTVTEQALRVKPRIIATTDGEVDDRSSMIRFLMYASDYDVVGIVEVNSRFQINGHSGESWMEDELDRYAQVWPNLIKHNTNYPTATYLRSVVRVGNENRNDLWVAPLNMATKNTPGEQLIIQTLLDSDPRPVHVPSWGGANTTASALWRLATDRVNYTQAQYEYAVSRIRIYCIWYQDGGGQWIEDNIKGAYINEAYRWDNVWDYESVGSGSENPADIQTYMNSAWLNANVKTGHGTLGAYTPQTYISEGDTPSFLHLINNGLEAHEDYTLGGWGGRSAHDDLVNKPNHLTDTIIQDDGNNNKMYWRWIPAAQNDFAARMDWCVATTYAGANHQPVARVVGSRNRDVSRGQTVTLDASPSSDPDGNNLTFYWWQYYDADSSTNKVTIANSNSVNNASFVVPGAANQIGKQMHIILEVTDNGTPPLKGYQRIICTIQ